MSRIKLYQFIIALSAGLFLAAVTNCDKNLSPVEPMPGTTEEPTVFINSEINSETEVMKRQAQERVEKLHQWTGFSEKQLLSKPPSVQIQWVRTGESIQEAVNNAVSGSVILIQPGLYAEEIEITTPNLTIIGMEGSQGEKVIVQNPGSVDNGFCVMPPPGSSQLHGFTLYNVTVRNFNENGVFLEYVRDFFIARTITIDNGEYGVYPVHSRKGIVYQCSAHGHSDSGIYIGQSKQVWLIDNLATDNVIGIEIENCADVVAAHNTARDNTAGIMAILLPPNDHVTVTYADYIHILRNRVTDNNLENFAHPHELAAFVPEGSGILVVGMKNSNVMDNVVTGNDFAGIATASTLLLGSLAGLPPEAFGAIDPDPQAVRVAYNTVTNNGMNPPDLPAPLSGVGVDILWDGSGMENCWYENRYGSSFPSQLPSCDRSRI